MDAQLRTEILELLKNELVVKVDINKHYSTFHNVTTTVYLGDEVISRKTVKCDIGSLPNY